MTTNAGLQVAQPQLGPYNFFAAVTKSDTTVLTGVSALYVGGTGDVAVKDQNGDSVTFSTVPAGAVLEIAVTKVLSTGTSATNIVALKR